MTWRLVARASLAAIAALGMLALAACKDRPVALAELAQATGAVERATGLDDWKLAKLGTKFFLGDAARTGDGSAQLRLGDASRLAMDPHTVLRFGRRGSGDVEQKLVVELGAIEIAGGGAFQLDVGEISVERDGGIRISASDTGNRVELLVGQASIRTAGGEVTALQPGVALDFADIEIRSLKVDAGRPPPAGIDAGADAGVDARADAAPAAVVTIEVTGKGTEVRRPGETAWRPLRSGPAQLEGGAQLKTGRASSARLDNGNLSLELSPASVAAVSPQLGLSLVSGSASVRSLPDKGGSVELPGGGVSLKVQGRGASSELTVGSRDSKVRVTGGELALLGHDSRLEMRRGESATLTRSGAIRVLVAVPANHDVAIPVGDSATVHDVRGAAAVQFRFADRCPRGGVVELDDRPSFRTPTVSAGDSSANLMVGAGSFYYRLRCDEGSGDGRAVASGRIAVVRDSGRRPLPGAPPPFQLDADGRTYRVGYQGAIPTMTVVWKGATGSGFTLRLAQGGKVQSFAADTATQAIPGGKLAEGTYTVWFEKDGARSKVSTLIIDFDNTAPAVYIEEPDDGASWAAGAELEVKGAVLPGWTASIEGVALPLDRQRRFRATVPAPATSALAIRLSHPQRGTHYYLRRRR